MEDAPMMATRSVADESSQFAASRQYLPRHPPSELEQIDDV